MKIHYKVNQGNTLPKSIVLPSLLLLCLSFIPGCKKFVDVEPPKVSITAATAYTSNASAAAVMTSIYYDMAQSNTLSSGVSGISFLEGLASDELTNYFSGSAILSQFYQNALVSNTAGASNNYFWKEIYKEIHVANAVIENVANSSEITADMKKQLDGEAKFIRAFYLFYAVNIYGDAPLVTTTDYRANNIISRAPKADVYKQIIQDLTDAQNELTGNYLDPSGTTTTERIRPNKGAAQALLARVYLYTGDWANAKAQADAVIANTNYSLLKDITTVFKKNSSEAIWQLAAINGTNNTKDALYFILTGAPGTTSFPVALSNTVVNAFEPQDVRLTKWVGVLKVNATTSYYYPFKYQVAYSVTATTEYQMVFRLAEQYLIRAEAKAQLGDISGAQADLNVIRSRVNLPVTTANDKASLLSAILHERQTELFTEWGHRWFDLIRSGTVNSVMGSPGNASKAKGGTWDPNWILAPLPQGEIFANPNLKQNPGYQ